MKMMMGGGGGGFKPRPPKKPDSGLCTELKNVLSAIDKHVAYLHHCKVGLEAHPTFSEELEGLTHFGIPVQMKQISNYEVPVLPNGWHVHIVEC